MRSPVVIFTYNRLDYLKQTLNALFNCNHFNEHEVFIFNDAPNPDKENDENKVYVVREYLNSLVNTGCHTNIHLDFFASHMGSKNAVISGITKIINEYGTVIDIEDDVVVSQDFLDFMDDGLEFFKNDEKVWSIAGLNQLPGNIDTAASTYFLKRTCSTGFAVWKDRWNKVDFEIGDYLEFKNNRTKQDKLSEIGYDMPFAIMQYKDFYVDAWDIQFCYAASCNDAYTVYPKKSKCIHIGEFGTHFNGTNIQQQEYNQKSDYYNFSDCQYDEKINELNRSMFMEKSKFRYLDDIIREDKMKYYYLLSDKWMTLRDKNISIEKKLINQNIHKIAIYGCGAFSRHLIAELNKTNIEVLYMVDKREMESFENIKVVSPDNIADDVDLIIVTPFLEYTEISTNVKKHTNIPCMSLYELIYR